MPSPKANAQVAVHAAVATASWRRIRAEVRVEASSDEAVSHQVVLGVEPSLIVVRVPNVGLAFTRVVHAARAELLELARRTFANAVVVTDFFERTVLFVREVDDTVIAFDVVAINAGSVFADSVVLADAITKSLERAISDSVTASDSPPVFNFNQVLADSVEVLDAIGGRIHDKGLISELVMADDAVSILITKGFADSVTVDDLAIIIYAIPEWNEGLFNQNEFN